MLCNDAHVSFNPQHYISYILIDEMYDNLKLMTLFVAGIEFHYSCLLEPAQLLFS